MNHIKINRRIVYLTALMVFLVCLSYRSQATGDSGRNPNSAKACAICHYRWIDTFFVEGKGSDLVEYQSEKVVATPEMCFSCHDGSVKDSRERLEDDSGHKVNTPPPPDLKIPEIFPLDENGRMQCSTCHTAHGVQGGPDSEETIFMRTSNKNSAMCRMCHPTADGGIDTGNHPAGAMQQKIPGKLISLGAVTGQKKNQIICETCHTAHGSRVESFLIEGAGNSVLCLDCHRDKNIFAPDGTRKPFHVINVAPETASIPERLFRNGSSLGYKGTITCLTCHKVHNNKADKQFLLVMKNRKSSLCLSCHSDKTYLLDTKHNLIHSAPGERNLEGKTVAEAGVCSACHLPHKPARRLSGENDFTTQLCVSCHSKGNIGEKTSPPGYTHPLGVDPFGSKGERPAFSAVDAEQGKMTLPLFNKYNVQDKKGRMTCSTCHEPHGSPANSTKRQTAKDNGEDKTGSFLRKQSPDICRECHRNKFQIANSKHDLSKLASGEKDILKQRPLEPGLCGGCHLVHGSQNGYVWAGADPTATNASGAEDLCVGCHNERGLARKKVLHGYSHPVGISPSEKGLPTTLPLYVFDGTISKDGVMRCQTCHDPHRWNPLPTVDGTHLDVGGHSQNSFLRLENSPSARLCGNCHPSQAKLEETDHDLTITALSHRNILGQTPAESGICGVCHLVHNSKTKIKLWAQEFGEGTSVMERLCTSCHSPSGIAKEKVPRISTHPQDKLVNLGGKIKGETNYLPLFHEASGEPVTVGNISCPSCHNVHQWNPRSPRKGEGVDVEGNATNSFLRIQSSDLMCKDCHGIDALFKFKFFHDPRKRKHGAQNLFR